ncbi:MAG: hypothetical protein V1781_04195, partial [Bacteroidota bacterium]
MKEEEKVWHYQENQFDNSTKKNFKLMNIINSDHFAKLQSQSADPVILTLLNRTTPLHDAFILKYSSWLSAKALYKGETERVQVMLTDLGNVKSKQWDIQIQIVYPKGSADYIAILPNGRKPLYSGTIDSRISYLQSFIQQLTLYPSLSATKASVQTFYTTLTTARDKQQQKEGLADNASSLLEIARRDIAMMMYRNLGVLMDKYAVTPESISAFWELALFRTHIKDDEQLISGKVTQAETGIPLQGVTITLLETTKTVQT